MIEKACDIVDDDIINLAINLFKTIADFNANSIIPII